MRGIIIFCFFFFSGRTNVPDQGFSFESKLADFCLRFLTFPKMSVIRDVRVCLFVDIVKYLDGALVQKISKRHFFEDIWNSFHEGTQMGPEPHQLFSFWDISTNAVARDIQSFGRNGPWQAGCLSFGQNFFVKFAETCDEQMLKISRRYLDL